MKGASSPSSVYRVSLSSTCTSPSFPAFVSSFACPSSPPHPVSYTPFSTWPSRRIHSRDTPLPPLSLFSLPFPSLPTIPLPFRFIPLRAPPPLTVSGRAHRRTGGDVPFYFIRGYEFFHPRRTGVSLAPNRPPRRISRWNAGVGLCRRRTRRGRWTEYLFLPFFFWKPVLLVIEECRFSSERGVIYLGELIGIENWRENAFFVAFDV